MKPQRLLAAAIGSALAASALAEVNTLPAGGQVAGGSATISTSGSTMRIDQTSDRAILNWQSFSIGSAAAVQFVQPGASSVALNRVVGSNPSEIFGRLTANGQVFLTNPHGVLFAPGAAVEAGALLATTLSITDQDFLAGRYVFANTGNAGEVVNQGSIATPNGYAALAGPRVRNDGVIVAQLGTVALAAGDRVTLDMVGDGLINVSVDEGALNALAMNTGTIEANGGRVLMRAASASELLDTVISNTGALRATRLAERNGEIILDAPTGIVRSPTLPETENLIVNAREAYFGTIQVSQPGQITFTDGFSITAGAVTQFTLPPTTAVPLSLQAGTVTTSPITGTIMITNQIGLLAPLGHSIIGTGIALPAEGSVLLQ